MLVHDPQGVEVVVGGERVVLRNVERVELERCAAAVVEEVGDLGPHAAFVDVVGVRTRVRIVGLGVGADLEGMMAVGARCEVMVRWLVAGMRRTLRVRGVLIAEEYGPARGGKGTGVVRALEFAGESVDGATDCVVVE